MGAEVQVLERVLLKYMTIRFCASAVLKSVTVLKLAIFYLSNMEQNC